MRHHIASSLLSLALLSASSAAAQDLQAPGWRAHLAAAGFTSTSSGADEPTLGFGLGLEYRVSDRLGFTLTGLITKFEEELEFDFFEVASLSIESELSATPVLVQLDWHLTPHHRVDLFLGPVAGYVLYGDQKVHLRGVADGEVIADGFSVPVQDGFAWGAQLGVNIPFGQSRAFLTARATYLKAEVEADVPADELGAPHFDLDPLAVQLGVGFRF